MPVRAIRITSGPNKGKYKVQDDKGKIHARATTRSNAMSQARLLNGLESGSIKPEDVGKPRKKSLRDELSDVFQENIDGVDKRKKKKPVYS